METSITRRRWLTSSACAVTAVAAARAFPGARALAQPACLPKEVAGIRIPDSKLARASAELAHSVSPDTLYNHCLRTYAFAALLYKHRGVTFDEELTFVAAALHDLGLVDQYMTPTENFPIDGADAAVAFLKEHHITGPFADTVWDTIAVHGFPGFALRKQPEIAAIALGAGLDVTGQGLEELDANEVAQVLEAFPRLDFKRQSIATMLHVCETKPLGVAMTPLAEVGRRHIPNFPVPTLEDLFLAAPFDE